MKLNDIEILALRRALTFLKYRCKTIDNTGLIASPIINNILERFYFEMDSEFDFDLENSPSTKKEVLETVKANICIFYEWNTYTDILKRNVIRDILLPFEVNDITLSQLIEEANRIHFKKQ